MVSGRPHHADSHAACGSEAADVSTLYVSFVSPRGEREGKDNGLKTRLRKLFLVLPPHQSLKHLTVIRENVGLLL